MKQIHLGNNIYTVVDDEDFALLKRYTWRLQKTRWNMYAKACVDGSSVLLHRLVMAAPCNIEVDHKDRDGLNNTKANLRLCSSTQNKYNTKVRCDNKTGYKGVYYNKRDNKYYAMIKPPENRRWYLGGYDSPEEAARAYNVAAEGLFGEFAYLNVIPEEGSGVSSEVPKQRG